MAKNQSYHHPAPHNTTFDPMPLPAILAQTTARNPQAPLIHFMGRTYSYAAMLHEAQQFGAALMARGIAKGDRVGLFLPNVPIYVSAYYGAMMAGAVVVNFSPLYSVEELNQQVADSGAKILVTVDAPELFDTAKQVLEQSELETLVVGEIASMLPLVKRVVLKTIGRSKVAHPVYNDAILRYSDLLDSGTINGAAFPDIFAGDLALLQYTGGTTGLPKGAMLTHENLSVNALQVCAINPFDDPVNEVFLGALPMFHVFANTSLLNHSVASGASIAMLARFEPAQVIKTIVKYRATGFPGVPTMFQALLDNPLLAKSDISSLKVCISGGAPLSAPLRERFESTTGVRLVEGYGLTETSGVVSVNPYAGLRKPGSIGQCVAGTDTILLDKEDPAKLAKKGTPGELAIAGPQVMQGYWNRPEAAKDVFIEHKGIRYLRTGDVAQVDEDGFLTIVDRIKDMIAVGGFKVFPSHVEAVLVKHAAVKEALIIGQPDEYLGETPHGFVTLEDGHDIEGEALAKWLNEKIGKHERVSQVVIRDDLPKTMIGKLDRKALREEVAS